MAIDSLRVSQAAAPVRSQVLENLRAAIVARRFAPGEHLRERELCELTGVSRTSIREALRQLESEGFVEVLPNRGPIVARLSARDAREIYDVREVMEGLAGRQFALNATEGQLHELQAALAEVGAATGRGDIAELLPLKDRFYAVLFSGGGNRTVERTLGALHARITALRATTLAQEGRPGDTFRELTEIVAAIESRDAERAEAVCRSHVQAAAKVALATLDDREDPD
jgi:DNA-binding GntR family transcriptional regulator